MNKEITLTGRGLTLPRGVRFTRTSLEFDPDLSPEEWAEVGTYLSAAHKACGVWTGDWVRHGRANYDEQFVAVQIGQLELPLHGVERFELQAGVAASARPEAFGAVTPEHLLVVAKRCEDAKDREDWLDRAARLGLSPRELQASIRAGEVVRIDEEKRRGGMPNPFAAEREFKAWAEALGDGWRKWTEEELRYVAEALRPMAEFRDGLLGRADELKFGPVLEKARAERLRAEKLKGGEG